MATKKQSDSASVQVSQADIEARARKIWENRVKKNLPGDAESDWLKAESELKAGKK